MNTIKTPSVDAIESYIEKSMNLPEIKGLLLDYKETRYSATEIEKEKKDKIEKALGIKERTIADWKKLFTFITTDGEITIKSYKGTDPIVAVPEFIGKNPVTAIDKAAFSEKNKTYRNERKDFFINELTAVILPQSITTLG